MKSIAGRRGVRACVLCEKALAMTCEDCNGEALSDYALMRVQKERHRIAAMLVRWSKVDGRLEPAAAAARFLADKIRDDAYQADLRAARRRRRPPHAITTSGNETRKAKT